MDKRWVLIIIIAVIGLGSMYMIIDNSMTVGSAITTFSKTTITIPDGFSVEDTGNNVLELYNKNNNEKIQIYDLGKGNTVKKMHSNYTATLLEEQDFKNTTNKTFEMDDVNITQTILTGENDTIVVSSFYQYKHTYIIFMSGYDDLNTTTQDLDCILYTLRPDYKQSQD
ncbi:MULTISPECIES: hypothetical protein [unclassified Methanobrevibacter]|uniref:hypothetical protein n=2 Tax=Methanobrevibacter TaxID=2172 RepID=UPI0025DF23C7|nr:MULTISPECIES: hypothetical protein [unclassified Methanobrevibacter]MEE0943602.1 hypothetical protein [Methanobrevibacter sp.]